MVAVRVYIEGGGNTEFERSSLRRGFRRLIKKLGLEAQPKIHACGGRKAALDEFKRALKSDKDAVCILLVDSEDPVRHGSSSWEHVRVRDGDKWSRPDGVSDAQLHLMVQAMEAWLMADPEALETYYGQGFRRSALPSQQNVELIAKRDVYDALDRATRDTKTKGRYGKSHGFELIGLVDPRKVRAASWHAARFFDALRDHLG